MHKCGSIHVRLSWRMNFIGVEDGKMESKPPCKFILYIVLILKKSSPQILGGAKILWRPLQSVYVCVCLSVCLLSSFCHYRAPVFKMFFKYMYMHSTTDFGEEAAAYRTWSWSFSLFYFTDYRSKVWYFYYNVSFHVVILAQPAFLCRGAHWSKAKDFSSNCTLRLPSISHILTILFITNALF